MTADDVRACPFCGHLGPFDQWPCEWLDGSGANVIHCPMCHGAAPAKTWNRRAAHADLDFQPAQAVDVGKVREVIEQTREYYERTDHRRTAYALEAVLSDIYETLIAALPKDSNGAEGADGWRPIATAPKDGKEVLVSFTADGVRQVAEASWSDDEDVWVCSRDGFMLYRRNEPTHWMPLPDAPQEDTPMLPDEVREAVDVVESHADDLMHCIGVLHAFKEMRPVGVEFSKAVDELKASTQTIRAHLLAREAEVERHVKMLADCFRMAGADPDGNEDWRIAPDALRAVTDLRHDYDDVLDWQARCERADALLRDASRYLDPRHHSEIIGRITAHLSENSRG